MATLTFNEIGGGNILTVTAKTTWANARTATIADSSGTGGFMEATKVAANNWNLGRSLMWFDTSALGAGATITSAKLVHAAIANRTNDDTAVMHIVKHTGTDSTIVLDDFDQTLTTSFGSVALGSLSTSATTDITLNATGLAAISKTGHTPLAIIFDRDKDNSDPTGKNEYQSNPRSHVLSVTYTPASTAGFLPLL